MPVHGARDCRFGRLGDSRRRDDAHIAGHVGKGGATRFADAHPDRPTPPEEPFRSTNVPIAGEPRGVVDRR